MYFNVQTVTLMSCVKYNFNSRNLTAFRILKKIFFPSFFISFCPIKLNLSSENNFALSRADTSRYATLAAVLKVLRPEDMALDPSNQKYL